jgi:hypothetical protein
LREYRAFRVGSSSTGASSAATNSSQTPSSTAITGRLFRISIAAASLDWSMNSVRETLRIAAERSMTVKRRLEVRMLT